MSDLLAICEPLIREFYANAVIREDELSCWVRRKEFTIDAHDIDEVLGLEGLEDHDFTNYKDRMLSIETIQTRIGGQREGRCLNTIAFPADMRCLTTIMMFNLCPVRKLTTINNAKAIFLMELKEKTIIRIQVRIPSDEEEGDQGEGDQMEVEIVAAGQASSFRNRGKRSRASTSSEVPPNAFQIILERIDGFREVQNKHTNRMVAIQDQLDLLSAKFDSFSTQQ